ncbi:HNH endonuclease signature motif containing protein [Delftia tsuruhatensis]|uniref:HNH endonuclease signature motif containing protein n=1 Tax=Delftia tsuruhatensis TaxID=180282 RepID=UPI00370CE36A
MSQVTPPALRPQASWTAQHIAKLRALYPDTPTNQVAQVLGYSTSTIYRQAAALGIKKSQAFNDSEHSGRIRRGRDDPRMVATQFQPGLTPWNKGVPGSTGHHENTRATQFKTRRPEESRNYLPIGSLRVTRDGLLERKMTDDRSIVPARRWTAVHRLVWEAANGPVPEGHIIVFRPGQRTTQEAEITADRLECISRAENARRNHPARKSPELAKLVQLKGAITRQVNRIAKESQPK